MQIVPDHGIKNREFAYLTVNGETSPRRFYPADMAGIYMRITPTGREVFGAVPDYFGLEGNTGTAMRESLFSAHPMPTLPTKGVKPGDTWASNFQQGKIELDKIYTQHSVVRAIPTRGEFLGVEWEMGHPCAKIKNTIAEGSAPQLDGPQGTSSGQKIASEKVSVEETVWFALDTGVVVKFFRDITAEGKANFGDTTGGSTNNGGGGNPNTPGLNGASGPGGRGGGKGPGDFQIGPKVGNLQAGPPPGIGAPGAPGQGNRGGNRGGGFPTGGNPGAGAGSAAFVRIRVQELFVLEK